jgi:hypothetical protein
MKADPMAGVYIDCIFESNPDDTDVAIMPVSCSGRGRELLSGQKDFSRSNELVRFPGADQIARKTVDRRRELWKT